MFSEDSGNAIISDSSNTEPNSQEETPLNEETKLGETST